MTKIPKPYKFRCCLKNRSDLITWATINDIPIVIGAIEKGTENETEHYHAMITYSSEGGLRKQLHAKKLVEKGNGSYSVGIILDTPEDHHRYAIYAVKEGIYFTNHKIYTKEYLMKPENKWKPSLKMVKKREDKTAIFITDWKKHIQELKQKLQFHSRNLETIAIDFCVEHFVEKKRIYDKYIIRRFVELAIGTWDKEISKRRMRNQLLDECQQLYQ